MYKVAQFSTILIPNTVLNVVQSIPLNPRLHYTLTNIMGHLLIKLVKKCCLNTSKKTYSNFPQMRRHSTYKKYIAAYCD